MWKIMYFLKISGKYYCFLIIKINSINIVQTYANVFGIINILISIEESASKTTRMQNPKLKTDSKP